MHKRVKTGTISSSEAPLQAISSANALLEVCRVTVKENIYHILEEVTEKNCGSAAADFNLLICCKLAC